MKMKRISLLALALLASASYADVVLQDWQFGDANGTALNNAANTAGTATFNRSYGRVQNGMLNIGSTPYYKWVVPTGNNYATASLDTSLTSGQYILEYVVGAWDFDGTGTTGVDGHGFGFQLGSGTGNAQVKFLVANSGTTVKLDNQAWSGAGLGSGGSADLSLSGTSVTVQMLLNLDTGVWSSRYNAGSGFVDMVTDGTGMNAIDGLTMVILGGDGWEAVTAGGSSAEFVQLDSVTLTQIPEPATLGLITAFGGGLLFIRRLLQM